MASKWRSSKSVAVDGDAFKQARRVFIGKGKESMRGEYGYGSQEWLANLAKVSPRTINTLETGKATVKTVDAVSRVLDIQGRELILGYGSDFTELHTTGVVDFRPGINGRINGNEIAYLDEPFLLTLDPINIKITDQFISQSLLKKMTLKLMMGKLTIDFEWLYNVQLTDRSSTWLGDEEDVHEVLIKTSEPYQTSVMFRQSSLDEITWKEFIDSINTTKDSRILLNIKLIFERFTHEKNIIVSTEELKNLFNISYPKGYPYWVQPNALMV